MTSSLTPLFRYARSSRSEALENFTTEVLAVAAREDPEPLLASLTERGLLRYDDVPTEVGVQTQVSIGGAGIIDLVLTLRGPGWTREIWAEVKVWAPESGFQLTNYKDWIAASDAPAPPCLVTIAKAPLPNHPDIPCITWQALRRAAFAATNGHWWKELRLFLEEIQMADDHDEPIFAREAAALLDAHALFRKASRIIELVTDLGRTRWPELGWPKSLGDADEQLLWQFKGWRRIVLPVKTSSPVRIMFGVAQIDASAEFNQPEPHLAVWLDHSPMQTDLRRKLLAQADAGGLDSTWTLRVQGWWAVTAHKRLGAFGSHAEATDWLLAKLSELVAADLINAAASVGSVVSAGIGEPETDAVASDLTEATDADAHPPL